PVWHYSGVAVTLFFLFMAGILFRSENIPHALSVAQRLFMLNPSSDVTHIFLQSTLPVTMALYGVFLLFCMDRDERARRAAAGNDVAPSVVPSPVLRWWDNALGARVVVYASLAIVILGFAPSHVEPFIYFQF